MDHPPEAHPAFSEHFADSLYDDLEGEFTPFGTDEGYDLLAEWSQRRDELRTGSLEDILGEAELYEALDEGDVDAATIVAGAAFTLLRLSGQIDPRGRDHAVRALDCLIDFYGPVPELLQQEADLRSWSARGGAEPRPVEIKDVNHALGPCGPAPDTLASGTKLDYDLSDWPPAARDQWAALAAEVEARGQDIPGMAIFVVPASGGQGTITVNLISPQKTDWLVRLDVQVRPDLPSATTVLDALRGAWALGSNWRPKTTEEELTQRLTSALGPSVQKVGKTRWQLGDDILFVKAH